MGCDKGHKSVSVWILCVHCGSITGLSVVLSQAEDI